MKFVELIKYDNNIILIIIHAFLNKYVYCYNFMKNVLQISWIVIKIKQVF